MGEFNMPGFGLTEEEKAEYEGAFTRSFTRRLEKKVSETKAEGRINGTHLMHAIEELDGMARVFAMLQVYDIACDDFRIEMGGLARLFSDFLLTGMIEDFNRFADEEIKLVKKWKPITKQRAEEKCGIKASLKIRAVKERAGEEKSREEKYSSEDTEVPIDQRK